MKTTALRLRVRHEVVNQICHKNVQLILQSYTMYTLLYNRDDSLDRLTLLKHNVQPYYHSVIPSTEVYVLLYEGPSVSVFVLVQFYYRLPRIAQKCTATLRYYNNCTHCTNSNCTHVCRRGKSWGFIQHFHWLLLRWLLEPEFLSQGCSKILHSIIFRILFFFSFSS
jgi:hypothetical protein